MMNIYGLQKIYGKIRSPRVKLLGLFAMHIFHKKYTCFFFDPVLQCNLSCQMCYFSSADAHKKMNTKFSNDDITAIAKSVFPHILKLQIGCGAEPTMYKDLNRIVALGHEYNVPYISITTNGMLLTSESLQCLIDSGLNEITLSAHGFTAEMYEWLMKGAKFDKFLNLLDNLRTIKADPKRQHLKIRVNYTINEDNVLDLREFSKIFNGLKIDVLQLRPIQEIGDSAYKNFSRKKIIENYDSCILPLVKYCKNNGIVCIYPILENLSHEGINTPNRLNKIIDMLPYFQLSPYENWKEKFNPYEENLWQYYSRNHRTKYITNCLLSGKVDKGHDVTRSMDYDIK